MIARQVRSSSLSTPQRAAAEDRADDSWRPTPGITPFNTSMAVASGGRLETFASLSLRGRVCVQEETSNMVRRSWQGVVPYMYLSRLAKSLRSVKLCCQATRCQICQPNSTSCKWPQGRSVRRLQVVSCCSGRQTLANGLHHSCLSL